jgi:hypothetical protein
MSTDELTPEEVRSIAAEIDAWHARGSHHPQDWKIATIAHLYALPVECYQVTYENGLRRVWNREEDGGLRPAFTWTYRAPDFERIK